MHSPTDTLVYKCYQFEPLIQACRGIEWHLYIGIVAFVLLVKAWNAVASNGIAMESIIIKYLPCSIFIASQWTIHTIDSHFYCLIEMFLLCFFCKMICVLESSQPALPRRSQGWMDSPTLKLMIRGCEQRWYFVFVLLNQMN